LNVVGLYSTDYRVGQNSEVTHFSRQVTNEQSSQILLQCSKLYTMSHKKSKPLLFFTTVFNNPFTVTLSDELQKRRNKSYHLTL